jgi:hypothetical protein
MNTTNRLCATVLGMAMLMTCVEGAPAQDAAVPLRVVRWSELKEQGTLQTGEVVEQDGPHTGVLKIAHPGPGPAVIQLAEITGPGITAQQYALSGQVRYENVGGTGFLEMLSYLPDGNWFFSRTLGQVGPMQSLAGTSTWRDTQLPASLGTDPAVPRPNRLVLNLHLEGPGTVYLSDFTLTHLPDDWAATFGWGPGWWSNRVGGLIGGALGSLLGIIGAVVGTLCGIGRGRGVVTGLLIMMAAAGVVCLVLGIVALALGQPYAVYYPLLLIGILAAVLGSVGIPVSRQRFAQSELRRMQALDAP